MPSKGYICANPKCGRLRARGGQSKKDGLCRLCHHEALMALPAEARKRAPYREHTRPGRAPHSAQRVAAEPGATIPAADRNWWERAPREGWGATVAQHQFEPVTIAEPNREAFEVSI